MFYACRGVGKPFLGSGGSLGTILDHLKCIRSDFEEKKISAFFEKFSSIFQKILACFWRILALGVTKNRFFPKIRLVWKIRSTKSFIWSHTSFPWQRLTKSQKLRDKLGPGVSLKTRFYACEAMQHEKMDFVVEIATFQKFLVMCSRHVGVSENIFWGPRSG